MRPRRKQVSIDVDDDFFEALRKQKLRRGLTNQELVSRAVRLYCSIPEPAIEELNFESNQFLLNVEDVVKAFSIGRVDDSVPINDAAALDVARRLLDQFEQKRKARKRIGWTPQLEDQASYVWDLLIQFPPEKVQLVIDSLKTDLRYYRSARVVSEPKK